MLPFFYFHLVIDKVIKVIIFDFGGLIINVNYTDIGKISAQRFTNDILNYLPTRTSPNTLVSAWNAMIKEVPIRLLTY